MFVYLYVLDGAEEGGCLDWKSCVQGIFRPPPNHYSLHHSSDNDAGAGEGVGVVFGSHLSYLKWTNTFGGDKCPVTFFSE